MSSPTWLFENYRRAPVAFVSGRGCRLRADDGREFLDFLSGIAVNSLGHAHPRLVAALQEQVGRLLHVSNLYHISEQERAAARLGELCGLPRAFFCNSGTEANEALIKLARAYAEKRGLPTTLVVAENGFHGRTMGALSATGTPSYRAGFGPELPGFRFVPYLELAPTLEALESACGLLIEPIQGEGGVIPADPDTLQRIATFCKEHGKLLLLDEVQTGIGRTGAWLAAHRYGVEPDGVSLAKGLGGGVPVGAVLASEELAGLFGPGRHGTTFGGNPLACAAVLAVLETLETEGLLARVEQHGQSLARRLTALPGVREVRGCGLMLGMETEAPAAEVVERCFERGLLVNACRPHTVRLLPPLVVSGEEIEEAVAILKGALCLQTKNVNVGSALS